MDPRHPELALPRIKELIKQYERIEKDIATSTVSSKLGQLEREGGLVVQEICLVAPRIHEAMMQTSRRRRAELTRGFFPEVSAEALKEPTPEVVENYIEQAKEECANTPKKKATRKKKTTKKKAE